MCNFYLLNNKDIIIYYVREAHQATRLPIPFINTEIKKNTFTT